MTHQYRRVEDVPLSGGRMTSGIVRRGERLLRPMGPWSPAVHEYLRHLEAAGFEGSPRVLGIEDNRQVLAGEIISHGDVGPWNTVYRNGAPVGFIDWDSAQPVKPLADLADAAWTFLPLAPPEQLIEAGFDPLPDLPARLRMFVDAYGLTDRKAILPALERSMLAGAADRPVKAVDAASLRWLQGIAMDLARAL